MDFVIKTYNSDPSIDFNQIQADIYNGVVDKYTGNVVTADQVKERIIKDKFDPDGIMYAFSLDDEPLAYIRYYIYPSGALYIGYPWCTPKCSPDIQDDLFNTLKAYVKQKYPAITTATMGMADNSITPFFEFAQRHHFEKRYWEVIYHIDVVDFSKFSIGNLSFREATPSDLNRLTTIALEDLNFIGQETYLNESESRSYLSKEILPYENCVLLVDSSTIVGAASVVRNQTRFNSIFTLIKYESLLKNYENQRIMLYISLAKLLHDKGLTDEKILISLDNRKSDLLAQLEDHGLKIMGGGTEYTVNL